MIRTFLLPFQHIIGTHFANITTNRRNERIHFLSLHQLDAGVRPITNPETIKFFAWQKYFAYHHKNENIYKNL
jgi:hypothetical protein